MITYRRHNCTRSHRTYLAFAKCVWKRAYSVYGEGPYALVTSCRKYPRPEYHVQLFATAQKAQEAVGWECGGACSTAARDGRSPNHKVVKVQM